MKHIFLNFLLILTFMPASSFALSCVSKDFTQEAFDNTDMIVKGTVSDFRTGHANPFATGDIPFTLEVEKAWKGTKTGEKINMIYRQFGGDGFPYQHEKTYIHRMLSEFF